MDLHRLLCIKNMSVQHWRGGEYGPAYLHALGDGVNAKHTAVFGERDGAAPRHVDVGMMLL